jgi:hypothetical protein
MIREHGPRPVRILFPFSNLLPMRAKWIIVAIGAIGIAAVLAVTSFFFLWGVYMRHWEGPFVNAVAERLPTPVARYAGKSVLLRTYLVRINAVKAFLASDEAAVVSDADRVFSDVHRAQAVEQLLREAVVEETARLRKITVTDEQVEQAIKLEPTFSGVTPGAFADHIQKTYGLTYDAFKEHIARPIILDRFVSASYAADHGGDISAFDAYVEKRLQEDDVIRYLRF